MPPLPVPDGPCAHGGHPGPGDCDDFPALKRRRKTWAQLLTRVLGIDTLDCPSCASGRLRLISFITEPEIARKILVSMGLPAVAPRASPPRAVEETEIDPGQLAPEQPA